MQMCGPVHAGGDRMVAAVAQDEVGVLEVALGDPFLTGVRVATRRDGDGGHELGEHELQAGGLDGGPVSTERRDLPGARVKAISDRAIIQRAQLGGQDKTAATSAPMLRGSRHGRNPSIQALGLSSRL